MKKNILLVQSLLVLPFLSFHPILCMEQHVVGHTKPLPDPFLQGKKQSKGQLRKARKRANQLAERAAREEAERNAQLNSSTEMMQELITKEQLEIIVKEEQDLTAARACDFAAIAEEPRNPEPQTITTAAVEPVQITTPAALQEETIVTQKVMADLAKSVMLPQEAKGLGAWNRIRSSFSSHRTQLIAHLKNKTFEIDNLSYFELLNNAVQESINQRDVESLLLIADLCQQDEYKNTIRIDDEKAKAASDLLSQTYTQHIDLAHTEIQKTEERNTWAYNTATLAFIAGLEKEINKYTDNVNRFGESYTTTVLEKQENAAALKKRLTRFANLNSGIRKELTDLVWAKTIETPEQNQILKQHNESKWRLQAIRRTGEIPTIESEKKQNILPIDNK